MKSHFSKSNEKEDISYLVRRVVPRQEAEAEEPDPEPSKGGNRPWEGETGGKVLCKAGKCLDVQEEGCVALGRLPAPTFCWHVQSVC